MDNILQFLPREEYEAAKWARLEAQIDAVQSNDAITQALTNKEIYEILSEDALEVLNRMLVVFKLTGQWTPDCNEKMKGIVREVLGLCKMMSAHTIPDPPNKPLTIPTGVPDDQNAG